MKNNKIFYLIVAFIFTLVLSLSFIGCKQDPSTLRTYQPPENIGDGLEVGTLDGVDIDKDLIEKGINVINRGKYKEVHSLLIYKDGKLVLDEYFTGHKYQWDKPGHLGNLVTWDSSDMHILMSASKSITSACIGIAVDNGYIESVDQLIFEYLPEHQHLATGGRDKITIEHLLSMNSGLDWDEWSTGKTGPENDAVGIWFSDKDPISFILELPFIYEPGTHFRYSSGDTIILGEIIRYATGMDLSEFSEKYLFKPMGINSFDWGERFPNGVIQCSGSLHLKPRDMVKIGVTYLNSGVWDDNQVISKQWVEKSSLPYAHNTGIKVPGSDSGKRGYSNQWWIAQYNHSGQKENMFFASGWGGQQIMVLPELDAVIVFTGGNYTSSVKNFSILEKYILPAIE